jgi:hypothetical protein
MKTYLLTFAIALISLTSIAQTKGTTMLGLGILTMKSKTDFQGTFENFSSTRNLVSLGFGGFIKDNVKIGVEGYYGNRKFEGSEDYKSYGGKLYYQRYFPLSNTLYAYAGGEGAYLNETLELEGGYPSLQEYQNFTLGAFGGITWFATRNLALETRLLSAGANYTILERQPTDPSSQRQEQRTFSLSSNGFINNLGFKVYFLF